MGDPPFEVSADQFDDVAYEGIIDLAVLLLEVTVLKLRVLVKRLEPSPMFLIWCHE